MRRQASKKKPFDALQGLPSISVPRAAPASAAAGSIRHFFLALPALDFANFADDDGEKEKKWSFLLLLIVVGQRVVSAGRPPFT